MKSIAYYRVSTERQGRSGLGREAQERAVAEFTAARQWEIVAEYREEESGAKNDRPELAAALAHAKRLGATLVIAKLDRLARNVHFISGLMESRVEFVACDMPDANRLTIHILAAVAEHERDMISQRTKDALASAKARGVELGKNGKKMAKKNREQAVKRAQKLVPIIERVRREGAESDRAIAIALNELRVKTPNGGKWHPTSVRRVMERL